jgi:hypothetical protein
METLGERWVPSDMARFPWGVAGPLLAGSALAVVGILAGGPVEGREDVGRRLTSRPEIAAAVLLVGTVLAYAFHARAWHWMWVTVWVRPWELRVSEIRGGLTLVALGILAALLALISGWILEARRPRALRGEGPPP